ncbi:MAG TPA: MarR family transcriptional regulator [Methanotrichaceae archaeon]|nr:MarR family transcriptional regulator [Methanotrichaceae archaeon]
MNQEERGALRRHMIDACVKAASNKGCCDAVGVLRGTLFLETKPMSMDRLVEETGYSKSTVSSNMNLLETLGLARRVVIPGDKRYHYVLVTDPDSLRKAMLVHIKNEIQLILGALDKTEKDLKDSGQELEEISKRIESIRHFYRQTERLLNLLARHTTDELVEILEKAEK